MLSSLPAGGRPEGECSFDPDSTPHTTKVFRAPHCTRAKISALGTYVPPRVLTNADLEKMVETNDQWITERTGIKERHILEKGQGTSDMAAEAARRCLAARGIEASEVEAIVVGTVTPDMMFPSTACLVQDKIGAKGAWGFDVSAGCCGFVFALQAGAKLVESGAHKKVLVIGGDANSTIVNYKDRTTCILFGDGAGAVLIEPAEEGEIGLIDFVHEIDGSGGPALNLAGGGSLNPASAETLASGMHFIHQDGQTVYKFAVRKMADATTRVLERNGVEGKDLGLLHSAPGQQAHHYRNGGPAGDGPGAGDYQYRKVRQYFGGDDSAGHGDGCRRGQAEEGRSGSAGCCRGWIYRGRGAAQVGDLGRGVGLFFKARLRQAAAAASGFDPLAEGADSVRAPTKP